jgi:hypothetical protein
MNEFKADHDGQCGECGADDEVMWVSCCGGYRCHDCHATHEGKWEVPAPAQKLNVCLSEIEAIRRRRAEINRTAIRDIRWLDDDGIEVTFTEEQIAEWEFIGLNNCDFPYTYDAIPRPPM